MVKIIEFLTSLKETITNLGTFSLIAILAIIILLIILIIIEKRLEKRMVAKKDKNSIFLSEVSNLKGKTQEETLKKINSLAREFFKERFNVRKSLGYSELTNFFSKQKNKKPSDFCREMNDLLYSGKEIDARTEQNLIAMLTEIIKENPIKEVPILKKPNPIIQKIKNIKKPEEPSENI